MNKTIISIEILDGGAKDAIITVKGERNNVILFEENFEYNDNEIFPLRLHLRKDRFFRNNELLSNKSLSIISIQKILNDIKKRGKIMHNKGFTPDYRDRQKQ